MNKSNKLRFLLLIPLLFVLAALIYQIPFVKSRLSWRIDDLKARLSYALNPPDEAVFVPVRETPLATPGIVVIPATPEPAVESPTAEAADDPAGPTATPLPDKVILENVIYVFQNERWNYCAPANLSMALNFWGWPGDRDDIARVVKPGVNDSSLDFIQQGRSDKNVMPSELIDFVVENTEYNILARHGGEIDLVKAFIANGFPVLIEKGAYRPDTTQQVTWMGHYMFTTGYDDQTGVFTVQDSYIEKGNTIDDHKDLQMPYQEYQEGWRSFNYIFLVVYPPDRQDQVLEILGAWSDPFWAYQHALELAEIDIQNLSGVDAFYAWFNKGTSLVLLEQYLEAGEAFDEAYLIYNNLEDDDTRPYRMTWYQTTPYKAYYFSGRYQDVINLANFTFETIADPTLEESLYWRGLAHYALGNKNQAKDDLYRSVWLNPNFDDGWFQINNLLFE